MKKLSTIALIACVTLSACGQKDPGLKDAYKNYFMQFSAVMLLNSLRIIDA